MNDDTKKNAPAVQTPKTVPQDEDIKDADVLGNMDEEILDEDDASIGGSSSGGVTADINAGLAGMGVGPVEPNDEQPEELNLADRIAVSETKQWEN